jgi:putative salt-induced outer membrane protein
MHISLPSIATALVVVVTALPALGAEGETRGNHGELELGLLATSGNTDTQSFSARIALGNDDYPWRHELNGESLHAEQDGEKIAERYLFAGKTDYRFNQYDYLFGTVRYEDDRFSSLDYRISETLGYGRRVMNEPTMSLDLELGVGGRHNVMRSGERDDEAIVRGAANFGWAMSDTARVSQHLFSESGSDNTYTESTTALKLKINSKLATKFAYTVRHNSEVPEGWENTDTTTSVTLILDF